MIQIDSKSRFGMFLVSAWMLPALSVAAQEQDIDNCKTLGELAAQIMEIRQAETPVSTVLDTFKKQDAPQEFKDLMRQIILIAYEQPAMRTPENKKNQIDRYRNDVELQCYSSGMNGN